jgi:hypothetical protein
MKALQLPRSALAIIMDGRDLKSVTCKYVAFRSENQSLR